MDVMLTDYSGPIIVCLWDSAALEFQKLLHQNNQQNVDKKKKAYLRVENIRVTDIPANEYNGHVLTTMKSIHSIPQNPGQPGTTLCIDTEPLSPCLLHHNYQAPVGAACIHHFLSVQNQLSLPFRATLRGSLQDVRPDGLTLQGQAKCMFTLVDDTGSWMQCCATGRNAKARALQNHNEVILYYVAGRQGTGSGDNLIWLWKESFIVFIGKKYVQKRTQVELK